MQIATPPMKTDAVPRTSRLRPSVNSRYDAVEIMLHWATALLVITLYFLAQAWSFIHRGAPSPIVGAWRAINTKNRALRFTIPSPVPVRFTGFTTTDEMSSLIRKSECLAGARKVKRVIGPKRPLLRLPSAFAGRADFCLMGRAESGRTGESNRQRRSCK